MMSANALANLVMIAAVSLLLATHGMGLPAQHCACITRPYPIMPKSQDRETAHHSQAPRPSADTASTIRVKLSRARPPVCRALR